MVKYLAYHPETLSALIKFAQSSVADAEMSSYYLKSYLSFYAEDVARVIIVIKKQTFVDDWCCKYIDLKSLHDSFRCRNIIRVSRHQFDQFRHLAKFRLRRSSVAKSLLVLLNVHKFGSVSESVHENWKSSVRSLSLTLSQILINVMFLAMCFLY